MQHISQAKGGRRTSVPTVWPGCCVWPRSCTPGMTKKRNNGRRTSRRSKPKQRTEFVPGSPSFITRSAPASTVRQLSHSVSSWTGRKRWRTRRWRPWSRARPFGSISKTRRARSPTSLRARTSSHPALLKPTSCDGSCRQGSSPTGSMIFCRGFQLMAVPIGCPSASSPTVPTVSLRIWMGSI